MQMTFRWYGEGNDRIKLSDIKQIPGVEGIVWALHDKMPGEVWQPDEIKTVMDQLHEYGFNGDVVESVNVHDDIKIGLPTRDKYIENYKETIRNLSKFGVKVICYNFMPIFDWTRSNLFHPVGDGSTALFYEKGMIQDDYNAMAKYILDFTEKYNMSFPGWEPERMAKLDELFKAYEGVDHEKLWANLKYFLEAIMPTCRECDIKMAIHMDDPPWDIFGLPRLLVDEPSIDRFLKMVDDPYNCLTLCSGSLNANPNTNVADIVRKHCDRIAFAHIRNVKHFENGDFSRHLTETATATPALSIFSALTTTAASRATSVPTTADTFGVRDPAPSVPATVSTTEPSAVCTCSACGICLKSLTKTASLREGGGPRSGGRSLR